MKLKLFILFLISSKSFSQVIDTQKYLNPYLEEGQCNSVADSKIYLKDFQSHRIDNSITTQIGNDKIGSLQDSETESYYFCKVKCKLNQSEHFIWITLKDTNSSFKELQGFVCTGIEITDVRVSSSLTLKTPIAHTFTAANSKSQEIRQVLRTIDYKLSTNQQDQLLNVFFKSMEYVSNAYSRAANLEFIGAGNFLRNLYINRENPQTKTTIKEKALALSKINWHKDLPLESYFLKDNLIDSFFMENGRFLEFLNDNP